MKHAWLGTTETTSAFRAFGRMRGVWVYPVELYDIALPSFGYPTPHILRWCDQPFDIPFFTPISDGGAAAVYASAVHVNAAGDPEPSARLQRGTRKESIGVEVDELAVDVFLDGTERLPAADGGGSTPRFTLAEAILAGIPDGAVLTLRRLHLALPPVWPIEPAGIAPRQLTASGSVAALTAYINGGGDLGPGDTSLGAVTLFGGLLTESTVSRSKATFTVKAALEKLNIGMPRNIYQANCLNDLGDRMCKVDIETGSFGGYAFKFAAAISSHAVAATNYPTSTVLLTTTYPTNTSIVQPPAFAPGYFEFGTLQFTSGPMAGLVHTIEQPAAYGLWPVNVTEVQLVKSLPRIPRPGDTVILRTGCRKIVGDCTTKFGNFVGTALTAGVSASVTTVPVLSTLNTSDTGWVQIEDEIIAYAGKTSTSFTGCTRGTTSVPSGTPTTAASHLSGALVYAVETIQFSGTQYQNIALNGIRFRGCIRVPPPESAL